MLSNIAEIKPPEIPPIYTATRTFIPSDELIEKVKGSINATAIEALNPGIDPKIIPIVTPAIINNNEVGSQTRKAAAPNCDKAPMLIQPHH